MANIKIEDLAVNSEMSELSEGELEGIIGGVNWWGVAAGVAQVVQGVSQIVTSFFQ